MVAECWLFPIGLSFILCKYFLPCAGGGGGGAGDFDAGDFDLGILFLVCWEGGVSVFGKVEGIKVGVK